MKKILCYGDSNTYGYNPLDGTRFDEDTRWTGVLQKNLGKDYLVQEEGMNNRNGFVNNPCGYEYTAQRHFPKLIAKNKDTDILVLAIGINDLQFSYDIGFKTIENGLEKLIVTAKDYVYRIILIPPPVLEKNVLDGNFRIQFDETSISKSKKVGKIYKKLANVFSCDIFDINDFQKPSKEDGLHYNKEAHRKIGEKLAEFIRKEK